MKLDFENDHDAMKMSFVYYVEIAMVREDRVHTKLDTSLFTTIEDLNAFNKIVWGSLLLNRTLKSQQNVLMNKTEYYKKMSSMNKDYKVKYTYMSMKYTYCISPSILVHPLHELSCYLL